VILFRRHGRNENPAWLQNLERPLLRLSSNGVDHNVHSADGALESLLPIVDNSVGTRFCPTGTGWDGSSCIRTQVHCPHGFSDCGHRCCRCTGTTCS